MCVGIHVEVRRQVVGVVSLHYVAHEICVISTFTHCVVLLVLRENMHTYTYVCINKMNSNLALWHVFVILVLGRLRQKA